jgi:hypothetical protein
MIAGTGQTEPGKPVPVQPEQGQPGQDSCVNSAGQDCRERIAGTGQLGGQDSWDR